jgi:hypothetical protein
VRTCTVASARDQQAAAAGHKSIKELQGAAAAAKTTTKKNGKKRGTGLKQHVAVAVAAAAAAAGAGAQAVAASSHPGSCTTKKQHVQAEVLQTSCFIPKSPTTSARSSKPSSAYSHESRISSCPPAAAALELLEGATAVSATQLHQYSRNHHQSLQGDSISHDRIHPAGAIISGAVEDHDQRDLESRELLETSCCCSSSSSSSNVLQSTNMQQLQDHHDAAHDTRFLKPM